MGRKEVYTCDACEGVITRPQDGYIVHGNIYDATVQGRGGLIGNNFPEGNEVSAEEVKESVYCKSCFVKALGLEPKPVTPPWQTGTIAINGMHVATQPTYTGPGNVYPGTRQSNALQKFAEKHGGYLNGNGILHLPSGRYEARVKIQDGTESCGYYDTEAEARQGWVDGHKAFNNTNRSPEEVMLFECEED
jgi:hypothetical protein